MSVETAPRFASPAVLGVVCGVGASLCWAAGLVAARHGVAVGFTPADLAFHRFVWMGLLLLPFALPSGLGEIRTVGWWRALVLLVLGGRTGAPRPPATGARAAARSPLGRAPVPTMVADPDARPAPFDIPAPGSPPRGC